MWNDRRQAWFKNDQKLQLNEGWLRFEPNTSEIMIFFKRMISKIWLSNSMSLFSKQGKLTITLRRQKTLTTSTSNELKWVTIPASSHALCLCYILSKTLKTVLTLQGGVTQWISSQLRTMLAWKWFLSKENTPRFTLQEQVTSINPLSFLPTYMVMMISSQRIRILLTLFLLRVTNI